MRYPSVMTKLYWFAVLALLAGCSPKGNSSQGPISGTPAPTPDLPTTTRQFEESRQSVLAQLDTLEESTETVLQDNDTTPVDRQVNGLPDAVEEWNLRWGALVNEFGNMESTFQLIGPSRDQHFAEMNQLAAEISDRQIRRSELKRNSRAYAAFNREYRIFYRTLGQARSRVRQGRDLYLVLNVTVKRRQFRTEEMVKVIDYAKRTRTLAHEMDSLLRQGRNLARELDQ